jgi:hypothetical protein
MATFHLQHLLQFFLYPALPEFAPALPPTNCKIPMHHMLAVANCGTAAPLAPHLRPPRKHAQRQSTQRRGWRSRAVSWVGSGPSVAVRSARTAAPWPHAGGNALMGWSLVRVMMTCREQMEPYGVGQGLSQLLHSCWCRAVVPAQQSCRHCLLHCSWQLMLYYQYIVARSKVLGGSHSCSAWFHVQFLHSWSGMVNLWSSHNCARQGEFRAHAERCTDVKWHPAALVTLGREGGCLATGSADCTGAIWSADGAQLRKLEGHTDRLARVAWHPMGRHLVGGLQGLVGHGENGMSTVSRPCMWVMQLMGVVRIWCVGGCGAYWVMQFHTLILEVVMHMRPPRLRVCSSKNDAPAASYVGSFVRCLTDIPTHDSLGLPSPPLFSCLSAPVP